MTGRHGGALVPLVALGALLLAAGPACAMQERPIVGEAPPMPPLSSPAPAGRA